jgi:hypothetical protein
VQSVPLDVCSLSRSHFRSHFRFSTDCVELCGSRHCEQHVGLLRRALEGWQLCLWTKHDLASLSHQGPQRPGELGIPNRGHLVSRVVLFVLI